VGLAKKISNCPKEKWNGSRRAEKMILEEAQALGLGQEDAERMTALVFERWTQLIREEVPNPDTQIKDHLENERLLELLRHAVDEVWEKFHREKPGRS
jgi:hypothetical protein